MKTTVSFAFDIPEEDWDKSSRELKAAYREAFDTLLGEDSTLDELLNNEGVCGIECTPVEVTIGPTPMEWTQADQALRTWIVRTNCEYSARMLARTEPEAIVKMRAMETADWDQAAWAPFEAEEDP